MALVVLVLALASKTVMLAPPAVLVWLGTISFSLYLSHTTVFLLLDRAAAGIRGDAHGWPHLIASVAIAVSVGALVHHYLEQRLSDRTAAGLRSLGTALRRLGGMPAAKPLA